MGKKPITKPLNVDVPDRLLAELDEALERRGWIKKRFVAAAIHELLSQPQDVQQQIYGSFFDKWLSGDDSSSTDQAAVDRLTGLADEQEQPRRRRKGTA